MLIWLGTSNVLGENLTRIYLDANGSCPPVSRAKSAVLSSIDQLGNPSSFHEEGRLLRKRIDESRHHVAHAIGAKEKELIFTSGASEANRLFVDALVNKSKITGKSLRVVMSPFEHPSLLKPVIKASDLGFFTLTIVPIDGDGQFLDDEAIASCDVLIACAAHNETGIVPNIARLISMVSPETIVMSDISQSLSRLEIPDPRIDVLTFSAQKMGGFAGVGGIVLRGRAKSLEAPWAGGGQERGFRPGTENSLLIFACGEAAREVPNLRLRHQEMRSLRDNFELMLKQKVDLKIIGKNTERLPNTSAICFINEDADALRIACDMAGLSVGFGSACSGLAPEGSFALKRLGLTLSQEKSTVRFSFPPDIRPSDIDETIHRLLHDVLTHKSRA